MTKRAEIKANKDRTGSKGGQTRTKRQREQDLLWIAEKMQSDTLSEHQMTELFNSLGKPYRLSRQTIHNDMIEVTKRMVKHSSVDLQDARMKLVAEVRMLKQKAYDDLEKSRKRQVIKQPTKKKTKQIGFNTELAEDDSIDDMPAYTESAAAAQFYAVILRCIREESRLMGLDTITVNLNANIKGAIVVLPANDRDKMDIYDPVYIENLLQLASGENTSTDH